MSQYHNYQGRLIVSESRSADATSIPILQSKTLLVKNTINKHVRHVLRTSPRDSMDVKRLNDDYFANKASLAGIITTATDCCYCVIQLWYRDLTKSAQLSGAVRRRGQHLYFVSVGANSWLAFACARPQVSVRVTLFVSMDTVRV
jgi:hypothetical protein